MTTVARNLGESGLFSSLRLSAVPSAPPNLLKGMMVPACSNEGEWGRLWSGLARAPEAVAGRPEGPASP